MTEKHAKFCDGTIPFGESCDCGAKRVRHFATHNEIQAIVNINICTDGIGQWAQIGRVQAMGVSNRTMRNIRNKGFTILSPDKQCVMLTTLGNKTMMRKAHIL